MSNSHAKQQAKKVFGDTIATILNPYKAKFENALLTKLNEYTQTTALIDSCKYSLVGEAKRFRPAVVYMINEALGKKCSVDYAALAVEFFHTASLIADDLPCMDNDDFRRGRPTVHKVYGEATSILCSFGQISSGFELIAKNGQLLSNHIELGHEAFERTQFAIVLANSKMGFNGLLEGQYLDMYSKEVTKELILEIIDKKTVYLFQLAFLLGWIFGGGDLKQIDTVSKLAFYFGAAFQVLDDLDDVEQDRKNNKLINFAVSFGEAEACNFVESCCNYFEKEYSVLGINSEPLWTLNKALKIACREFIS